MKESITKFDLEAAFKALDELDIPQVTGLMARRAPLQEVFSKKTKMEALIEEYYDIGDDAALDEAQKAREAEIAAAKLARIEKIVDLDAKTPDELLTSYVGKFIMQCPQCMTLFYKNKEDIEESEDDPTVINVNEVCQHCGNESGYTLIGKVGAAEEELPETEELTVEEPAENTAEEETSTDNSDDDENLEDFDLDSDLEEINLDAESDEDNTTEEAFLARNNSEFLLESSHSTNWDDEVDEEMLSYLAEQSTNELDLEVSADDFEKLIKSPEFKKPISDTDIKAMIDSLSDSEIDEQYRLDEGGLGTLGKTLIKRAKQIGSNIKNNLSTAIDKYAEKVQTREEKADWVLANARKDYDKIKVNQAGELVPDEPNQRFKAFVIIGYTNKYSNGKVITMAPSFNNKDLIMGMKRPEVKKAYKDADSIAKGWSMKQGNGPAFIFLAEDPEDENAVFLCEYFQGELEYDQLEKYFNVVKKDLEGGKLISGMTNQADDDEDVAQVDPVDVEEE